MGYRVLSLVTAAAVLCAGPSARAAANLVVNGDFETFSSTSASQVQSPNDANGAVLSGWSNAGYTFLFTPGSADTTGSTSQEYGGQLNLWGPGVNRKVAVGRLGLLLGGRAGVGVECRTGLRRRARPGGTSSAWMAPFSRARSRNRSAA